MNITESQNNYYNKKITCKKAERILYDFERNERFEILIALI